MVWGGVCSTARTDLHVFSRETMNSTVYVTDILEQYVVPFADRTVSELCPSIWTKAVLLLCNGQKGVRTLTR
jgi:hypothetical protein